MTIADVWCRSTNQTDRPSSSRSCALRRYFSPHIAEPPAARAASSRLFIVLAVAAATFVSRALTGQIATFLAAARRLSRGDFRQLVPVEGNDEFAQLGREFNDMSGQLEAKIEEVEHKRQELEETIRRVGDALATGLDRDGVVAACRAPGRRRLRGGGRASAAARARHVRALRGAARSQASSRG